MHSHENEQLTYILEGTLRFWLGDDEAEIVDVHAGEVLHIPANVPHRAEALEDTLDVDVFCRRGRTGSTAPTRTCASALGLVLLTRRAAAGAPPG